MVERPVLLVSACLCGIACRLDGGHHLHPGVRALRHHFRLVPVCPEQLGGLATPRSPAEITGGGGEEVLEGTARVLTRTGEDVTESFVRGARQAAAVGEFVAAAGALLKARSPSCGVGTTYDGTFTLTLRRGSGVTAALLARSGLMLWTEEELPTIDPLSFAAAFVTSARESGDT